MKWTEDEVVLELKKYLEENGWYIGDKFCLGHKHGIDIEASKNGNHLLVEVKGARASDKAHNKKRKHFDSGQIKTHFGKALVKVLSDKSIYPDAEFAIGHPDDPDIRKSIGHIVPFLKLLGIKHFWVSKNFIDEL